ncbi:peptidylprolyl isomerase [Roseibium limicola]|uniref:Parvulin-like PPIase n=1 Tax=Roseibium limicola TaxID=2816037 RepID=A0A939ESU1_9HYPH|nr:peptidylprolyl isomerase [Roseibium limicola]MBO0347492.1 peptidylprolyl isomerase [Roseibium limicola]
MFQFSMRLPLRSLAAPAIALTLGLSTALAPAYAAEPDDVVAKVGEATITEADLAFAAQELGKDLQRFPPAQWRQILLDILVDMKLLAHAAEEAGIDEDPDFKRQMDFLEVRALRGAYVSQKIDGAITEDALKAAYDKQFADFEGPEELHARHILVKEEDEAKAIIKQLDEGADFVELAKEKSTGPSGPNGGDLGFFSAGQMVKPFEDAAMALEKGAYTKEPVQTQFGWHVIKLEDKRKQEKPSLEEVADQLRQPLLREAYKTQIDKLKAENEVVIVDEKLKAAVEAAQPAADTDAAPAAQ